MKTLFSVGLPAAALLFLGGCGTESEVIVPEGTALVVRTTSTLSTETMEAGDPFTASLEEPLFHENREILSKGARVEGKLVEADDGGRVKGVASLIVRLTGIQAGSEFVDLSTNTVTRNAATTKRTDATEIAVGAGVGAVIGALAGGGKGAAIGAAAGGGAGTGVVLATHGVAAVIPSETRLTFELRAPFSVVKRTR